MSIATDIADAVVNELNDGTFSQSFNAERSVMPERDLSDLSDLVVTVVPRGVTITNSTRATSQYEITINVGVQQKVEGEKDDAVATLGAFVDELAEFLSRRQLEDQPGVQWSQTENDPIYSPQHLSERHVFTSVLTITYKAMK